MQPDYNLQESDASAREALGLRHKLRIISPAAPLVLLVHGRAGNIDVMWTFRRAIPDNCSVISVEAPIPDPLGGFSWWLVREDGEKRAYEDALPPAARLRDFIGKARVHYGLTPAALAGVGFSQGAGLLSIMLQQDGNPFDGAALLAGFVIPAPDPIKGKTRTVLMLHGSNDTVVPLEVAKRGAERLSGLGYDVRFEDEPVGHKIGSASVRSLSNWLIRISSSG